MGGDKVGQLLLGDCLHATCLAEPESDLAITVVFCIDYVEIKRLYGRLLVNVAL
jgi:hypothetical protein